MSELPIPDYDELTTGDLQHRIRTLDVDGLERVAAYEREHAGREHVLTLLDSRRFELAAGAEPSGGDPAARHREPPPPSGGSHASPQTSGPPVNPPSHGVPSNPAQPRR